MKQPTASTPSARSSALRRSAAELVLIMALRLMTPALFAISEVDQRSLRRPPIVQTIRQRDRSRALERRYGRELRGLSYTDAFYRYA